MIYTIVARNPKDEILEMVLAHPERSGINVINVTGISPIGAEIYSTPFGSVDGGIFSGARVPSRNIVMTLGMYRKNIDNKGSTYSIEDSRLITYNFFRIKEMVNLVFYTDNRILQITGYVESNDVDVFSEKEIATISIVCVDPWFHSNRNYTYGFSGTMPSFEFPTFTNINANSYGELIEFGNITIDTRTNILYEGDIQTGFDISITFSGSEFHNIYIYNMDTRERIDIYTDQISEIAGSPLDSGDQIDICTKTGSKTAFLLRNGIYTNIISAVDKNSSWFKLSKGNNEFAFASDYGVENIYLTISYENTYGGI